MAVYATNWQTGLWLVRELVFRRKKWIWKSPPSCMQISPLPFLYKYFYNDWPLALAAYNTGPGNVRKAIRRSGYKKEISGRIYPFISTEKPRSYVPQFIAIMYSMNYLEEHKFLY